MLFKHSTPVAREAAFARSYEVSPDPSAEDSAGEPPLSPEQLEIAVLTAQNEALRDELAELSAGWHDALAAAEARALEEARREHVRDDAEKRAALVRTLDEARDAFAREMVANGARAAVALSAAAFRKLADLRRGDAEWLADVVERRLRDLDRDALVSLGLSQSDMDGDVAAAVRDRLPRGTAIEADAGLRPGTARLHLRLGTVEIDPDSGVSQLLAVLSNGADRA